MKIRRVIVTLACAALLVVGSVAATMAYLTSQDTVTNTFTVGDVDIKLDEAKVDPDGTVVSGADRVDANEYHLIPGHTYAKDPMVTVLEPSEESYVRMIVTVEGIDKLKAALPDSGDTAKYYADEITNGASKRVFMLQALCVDENGDCTWNPAIWKYYPNYIEKDVTVGEGAKTIRVAEYEFRYHETVAAPADSATDAEDHKVLEPLFTSITVPGEIENDELAHLEDVKIVVAAHAIQADGFDAADKAWSNF